MLIFRVADSADVRPLVELVTSAYRGDASREGWTTEAHLLEGQRIDADLLGEDLANPDGRVLVGIDDDGVDDGGVDDLGGGGVIACCNLVRKPDGVVYLGMFAVSPRLQGAGLGKQVLAEAERVARDEWSAHALEITVLEPRTDLLEFYGRRGFEATGSFVPFPYGDPRFGNPLRDDLRMVVLRKAL